MEKAAGKALDPYMSINNGWKDSMGLSVNGSNTKIEITCYLSMELFRAPGGHACLVTAYSSIATLVVAKHSVQHHLDITLQSDRIVLT
eukprot:6589996-Ditylum_brightwellii.AAC.1